MKVSLGLFLLVLLLALLCVIGGVAAAMHSLDLIKGGQPVEAIYYLLLAMFLLSTPKFNYNKT